MHGLTQLLKMKAIGKDRPGPGASFVREKIFWKGWLYSPNDTFFCCFAHIYM